MNKEKGVSIIYTDTETIYKKVMDDYFKYETELNGLFFDMEVSNIKKKDLLLLYQKIQHDINGDNVVRLLNPVVTLSEDGRTITGEKTEDLIPDGEYEELYTGNYEAFLLSFNNKEEQTGLARFNDDELLDFVF